MKAADIKIQGIYEAKVNGKLVPVRVNRISTNAMRSAGSIQDRTTYGVTNLKTGRTTTFRSAAKFRREINSPEIIGSQKPVDSQS